MFVLTCILALLILAALIVCGYCWRYPPVSPFTKYIFPVL